MQTRNVSGSPLSESTREAVAELLQQQLVELLDLSLQSKQAHWNVVGPNFQPVHEQLDAIHALVGDFGDTVAERINAVGQWPNGQHGDIARGTQLEELPKGPLRDRDVLEGVSLRLGVVLARTRERIEKLGELDPVSEDLLIQITADLEKQLWMLDVQRA